MQLTFDFVDKNFRLTDAANYRLSIQLALNGYSFCVYDVVKNKHVMLKNFVLANNPSSRDLQNEFAGALENIPVFDNNFAVNCLYFTRKNLLIPQSVFSEKDIKTHLSFWFQLDELEEINVQYLPEIEAYNCFAIPSWLVAGLKSRIKNIKIFNLSAYYILQNSKLTQKNSRINMVFCGNFVEINCFKNGDLILNNTFEISDIKDVIYFVTAITKKIDLIQSPIFVSGELSITEINTLKIYFPNLTQKNDRKTTLKFGSETSSRYYNLLSLHECE